ncbi:hypothetical protein B0T16DRAFT_505206 [Cercophora newfieldiana]|uniref:Uncharacterized protein n=1 Tax=Cercophora newfieldiana TaxID=92897 RepID=A0AA39YKE4_9PEZI|nr:hypothetical protein B0T16DRAFT_505206 [Cercophora newfieldiana]
MTDEELTLTSGYFHDLEELGRIESSILTSSKVHKVMKGIIRLDPEVLPQEQAYRFLARAQALLAFYLEILAEDGEGKEERISGALEKVREEAAVVKVPEQAPVGKMVERKSSTDQWVWVKHEDAKKRGDESVEEYEERLSKWMKGPQLHEVSR